MPTFTIPTIYTAVDKYSGPVRGMQGANRSFANSLGTVSARSERLFRTLTPGLGEASKQFLSFASTAAVAGAAIGGIGFSVKSIMDYETAVQSFRTIVSDLDDSQFAPFQKAITSVAENTKKSSIETAQAFEKIAGLNSKFAETSTGLSQVAEAAITLSKASRDELGVSAENLVGIMNQFSFGANQANRTINVLAAGQAVGAASITQTSEAFVNFGSVAAGANITLEQSVGLVETLGKFSLFGAEAGTKLRGSVLKLQQAGVGYKSGQFAINDALEEAKKKVDKLRTSKEKDAAVLKLFGAENIATGKILLNNIGIFKEYTKNVTATSEAQKQADINSNTLSVKLDELKAAWINMLTGSTGAGKGLDKVKDIISAVTRNLDTIVSTGISVIKFYALWKIANLAMRGVMLVNNIALGISVALQRTSAFALRGNAAATTTFTIASKIATASTWLFNAALSANPILLAVMAIAALTTGLYFLSKRHDELIAKYRQEMQMNLEAQMSKENDTVNKLAQSYMNLGLSKKEAMLQSIAFEKQSISLERMRVEQSVAKNRKDIDETTLGKGGKIFGEFTDKHKKAQADLVTNSHRLAELASKNQALTEQAVTGVQSGVFTGKEVGGILNKKDFAGNGKIMSADEMSAKKIQSLNEAKLFEMQGKGMGVLNPKEAQATANSNAMKGEVKGEIIVKTQDTKGATTSSTSMPIMPVTSSTYK